MNLTAASRTLGLVAVLSVFGGMDTTAAAYSVLFTGHMCVFGGIDPPTGCWDGSTGASTLEHFQSRSVGNAAVRGTLDRTATGLAIHMNLLGLGREITGQGSPFIEAGLHLTLEDRLRPQVVGIPPLTPIALGGTFRVHGNCTANVTGGDAQARALYEIFVGRDGVFATCLVDDALARAPNHTSDHSMNIGPQDVRWCNIWANEENPAEINWRIKVDMSGFLDIPVSGAGNSGDFDASFANTFTWEGITSAVNMDTGESIPLENVHLIGDDGFDWAHPALDPTPAKKSTWGRLKVIHR